jgi:hypothetical protein
MSQRIADASAKLARSFYPLPRMTDNVLLTSLGQLTDFGEVVQHSNVVKSFSSSSARQHADQPIPDPVPPSHTIAAFVGVRRIIPVARQMLG